VLSIDRRLTLLATSSVPFDNVRSVFSWDHTLVLDPKLITSNKISLLTPTSLIATLSTHSSFLQTVATDNLADVPLATDLSVIRDTLADRAQDEVILETQPEGDGEVDAPDVVRVEGIQSGSGRSGSRREDGSYQGGDGEGLGEREHSDGDYRWLEVV
jgi:hypothetical protein